MNGLPEFTIEAVAARKAEARLARARLTLSEKIAILERLRAEMPVFAALREKSRRPREE